MSKILLIFLAIISSLTLMVGAGSDVIYRYWDGPNYAYVAETLYNINTEHPLAPYSKPGYFAAHLPLYPVAINIISNLPWVDINAAMIAATVLFTVGATLVFYQLLVETKTVASPLYSATISLFIPARYLIYHSVGATEAPFLFLTLLSLLFYIRERYLLSFVIGGLSGITRITGVLIGVGYFLHLAHKKKFKLMLFLPIIGLPLLGCFVFYHFHYGDFFAYFKVNSGLLRLNPFEIFRVYSNAGDTHSAEFYLMLYALYGAGVCLLWSKHKAFFFYALPVYVFSCFIFHGDLARYLIPIAPFALVVGYDSILSNRFVMAASPAYAALCHVYAIGVLPHNLCVDWVYRNFLKAVGP